MGEIENKRLYLITDRTLCSGGLVAAVEEALEAGVRMVQLREKDLGSEELLSLARELRELTDRYEACLLINGRIDIALTVEADGVHLAHKDFTPGVALSLLQQEAIIGVSCHSLAEALVAEDGGANFITLGPVYPTPSKARYGGPVGTGPLKEAAKALDIPIYAIGGIDTERIGEVTAAGAYWAAVISAILKGPDVLEQTKALLKALEPEHMSSIHIKKETL
jgi:thiamine-phosphate pyrophosphorylase